MKSKSEVRSPRSERNPQPEARKGLPRWTLALAGLGLTSLPASAWQLSSNATFRVEAQGKQGYDDNVYLQNQEPNRTLVPQAVSPNVGSSFTTLTPKLVYDYKPSAAFGMVVSYAPDISFYYSAPSENNIANRGVANFGGQVDDWTWDLANSLLGIIGQDEGLYFGGTPSSDVPGNLAGNAPALGGIPARDRRNAVVYRGNYRFQWTKERWFIRPVATAYVHNFMTEQKDARYGQGNYGYENYVDRSEYAGGLDVGYQVLKNLKFFIGYRHGYEGEGTMPGSPYHYDTTYNRPLGGIEGQPWSWFKVALALGDDIHTTSGNVPKTFDKTYSKLWGDVLLTFLPTKQDTITFKFTRNTQPAFSSPSVYDDTVYDLAGRHKFSPQWSVGAGMRWYNGDWLAPVTRNDWIYTASASLAYTHDKHLSAELAYSHDWTDCSYPPLDTAGREYTRNLVWLSVKYAF